MANGEWQVAAVREHVGGSDGDRGGAGADGDNLLCGRGALAWRHTHFPMTPAHVLPTLVVPLIAWRLYARIRRTIGRQHFRPRRSWTSVIIFSGLTLLVAGSALRSPAALGALGLGVALAVPLGVLSLRLTRFETSTGERFYIPNSIIGIGVTVLFIARLTYRMTVVMKAAPGATGMPPLAQSPLTLALYGLTAGYYVTYSAGLLLHNWQVQPERGEQG